MSSDVRPERKSYFNPENVPRILLHISSVIRIMIPFRESTVSHFPTRNNSQSTRPSLLRLLGGTTGKSERYVDCKIHFGFGFEIEQGP